MPQHRNRQPPPSQSPRLFRLLNGRGGMNMAFQGNVSKVLGPMVSANCRHHRGFGRWLCGKSQEGKLSGQGALDDEQYTIFGASHCVALLHLVQLHRIVLFSKPAIFLNALISSISGGRLITRKQGMWSMRYLNHIRKRTFFLRLSCFLP